MSSEIAAPGEALTCPHCGARNERPRRFCGDCGKDIQRAAADLRERRHLTVMFCDLVGSTAMSERMDPEEYGDVILAYREVVAGAAKRYGGYVARYVGDGVLLYFGYPRANEDDPHRALHCALQVVTEMGTLREKVGLRADLALAVRIGIHTGLVMVGDLAGDGTREEAGVVGETPNLAARLMGLAPQNGVIVSGATRELAGGRFDFEDLGEARVTGISRPVVTHRLLGARPFDGVPAFALAAHGTPIVNRTEELGTLQAHWAEALAGRGSALEVTGEAGIGKSRLVFAFADYVRRGPHHLIALQCSPYLANSAFHPVVSYLQRWLENARDKLDQLARAARELEMPEADVVPAIAELLSIPLSPGYTKREQSPRMQRDVTMGFLREWLARLARRRPALLLIEDFQWADASTRELLESLLRQIHSRPLLLVTSRRSDAVVQTFEGVPTLNVDRLSLEHVQEMIGQLTADDPLPPAVCERVALNADGVPLFIEELTKAIQRTDAGSTPQDGVDIPLSLHATLMARLDRLGPAKAVAQRAAVIGREFSYELIAAMAGTRDGELDSALQQLVDAELLLRHGTPPRAMYAFRHALIQESAYRSLLRAHRRQHHQRVARALQEHFPQTASTQPELIAHHLSLAHEPLAAARHWRKAGEQALSRSANAEACAHIRKGLDELKACSETSDALHEEVMLLLAFGGALSALKGSASSEVEQTYARARELCAGIDDPAYLFPILRGLHSFYLVRGPLRTACRMIEQLRDVAERGGDRMQRVEARRRHGWCLFCMGKLEAGRESLLLAMEQYDAAQSGQHIITYGSDPAIIGYVNLAWIEWFAGREESAIAYSDRAIAHAHSLSYGLGLAYALGMSAALYQCMGNAPRTAELAALTIELANKHGFPYWSAWETALLGWARASSGDIDGGIALMNEGLASYRETGSELFVGYMRGLLAEAHLRAERYEDALSLCEAALDSSARSDACFFDAEIHRIEGETVWRRDRDRETAMACFGEALVVARQQGAGMLERRVVRSIDALSDTAAQR